MAYQFFAVSPRTLEPVLADELKGLGAKQIKVGAGGVSFEGTLETAMAVCYDSHDIYDMAHLLPWEKFFDADCSLRVDVTAKNSPLESLDFTTLRIKDGICDRFREGCGVRPSIEKLNPDVRIHAFISERYCTFYLNLSGEPLFKRGWRIEKGEAPLKENMAAGLLALAGWNPSIPLVEPFCGSGTIAIEAAQIACNMAPGLNREFAFEKLHIFDMDRWEEMKEDARAAVNMYADVKIAASDISSIVVGKAQSNAQRAGLGALLEDGRLTFKQGDAREVAPIAESGMIVAKERHGGRHDEKRGRQHEASICRLDGLDVDERSWSSAPNAPV